ncbi:hypothetical protein [Methanobacterium alcaliphilum]|uniref:hypothetical protein n=1 Tax=Methanobacterium alcaliphilum TaxID=392018 RepID=UPI00200A4976|nr:hypothetical protein [Methanobacterium alcaliphilum]MCK9150549.1 hypothetical protein [Methanobacterium alcaliphilum]
MFLTKNKKWGLLGVIFLVIFLSFSLAAAHQPRLVSGNSSIENPVVVKNPEISQAFYGQLNGAPAYYEIKSNASFNLYVNILVPDNPGSGEQLMSVEILNSSQERIALLDRENSAWKPYFEEFGGDNYLKGGEYNQTQPAGTYYIKVFNENNAGKYSLAIGDIESFPADESLNAIILLPLLKAQIFQVPVAELFFQFIGLILAVGVFSVMCTFILKSRKSEETLELTKTYYNHLNPLMWIGIILTAIMWLFTYSKNPLNILGMIETLLLVVVVILHWNLNSKLKKLSPDKIPAKISTILIVFWIMFLFLRIVLIQS